MDWRAAALIAASTPLVAHVPLAAALACAYTAAMETMRGLELGGIWRTKAHARLHSSVAGAGMLAQIKKLPSVGAKNSRPSGLL